ncbi:MAG: hypothetical protein P8J37_17770 [Fuerstiella sp.]|nr:hypothetical protein [Fuerstiella sp.]
MRLLRLFFRIVVPPGLVGASAVWLASRWVFLVVTIPLPTGALHLRADHEGWVFQLGDTQSVVYPTIGVQERQRGAGDWHSWMQDIDPFWLGSAFVFAEWQPNTSATTGRFLLFGVKHYVVVLMSVAAVCMLIHHESLQKQKDDNADSVVDTEI